MKPTPVLCTAEAFGFGPAAALHQIVPHLRAAGCNPEYLGCGWTLEMHTGDMYQRVADVDVRDKRGRAQFEAALRDTPYLLSVCDLKAAEVGVQCRALTVLYDVLAWFRRPAPQIYRQVRGLVCPDFFGVREALRESGLGHARVVPPFMPPQPADHRDDGPVVLNLGGLQTPYSDIEACGRYARCMADAVQEVWGPPLVLTSHAVGAWLDGYEVRTVGPLEARSLVADARFAFLTGGIGNIMDAAGLGARVCFLPPMSQSQGLQLALLRRHVPQVPTIAWHEIAGTQPLDYHADHDHVMPAIAQRIAATARQDGTDRLRALMRRMTRAPEHRDAGRIMHREFLQRFGRDDGRQAAAAIVASFAQLGRRATP